MWSGFGPWSKCSVTCGEGLQQRKRKILQQARNGGERCNGNGVETRSCSEPECPGTNILDLRSQTFATYVIKPHAKLKSSINIFFFLNFQLIVNGIDSVRGLNVALHVAKVSKEEPEE